MAEPKRLREDMAESCGPRLGRRGFDEAEDADIRRESPAGVNGL